MQEEDMPEKWSTYVLTAIVKRYTCVYRQHGHEDDP